MPQCDDEYPWLSEFLCEYVDGTMDPAALAAFEERLRADPRLAGHAERLRQTRHLLCRFGCDVQAPCNLHETLRRRLSDDLPARTTGRRRHAAIHPHALASASHGDGMRHVALRSAALMLVLCAVVAARMTAAPDAPEAASETVWAPDTAPDVAPEAALRFADAGPAAPDVHPVLAAQRDRPALRYDARPATRHDSLARAERLLRIRALP